MYALSMSGQAGAQSLENIMCVFLASLCLPLVCVSKFSVCYICLCLSLYVSEKETVEGRHLQLLILPLSLSRQGALYVAPWHI